MAVSARHAGHEDMDMTMSMGGVPSNPRLQQLFWVVIGSVIAFATLVNILERLLLWQRLRSKTARPTSLFWLSIATATAITREIYSSSTRAFHVKGLRLRSPLTGKTIIVSSYFIVIIVFCFVGLDTTDKWAWEDVAVRIGHIGQAQFPLIFLLAGKQNIIGYLSGLGYERLNWLHRWIARVLWVTMTMHMSFFFRSWMRWNYVIVKLKTDHMTQTGFAAWCILTAIVGFSFGLIRRWNYEIFVLSHLVLFAGLIGAVMIHVDAGKIYFWVCIGLFFFDRLSRFFVAMFCNLPFLHLRKGLWANTATFTPLPGNVTRISIEKPLFKWTPGQHVFLSCHGIVPLQSHPFTIASLPSDGKLEFLVQARNGGTKRFHRYASKLRHRLPMDKLQADSSKYVGLEGPYGKLRPLHQFDSIVFLAGSTGASYTTPLMRDIVQRWCQAAQDHEQPVTKSVRFIWAVKSRDRLCWFEEQLERALSDVRSARALQNRDISLDVSIYVTCDEDMKSLPSSEDISACDAENTRGEAEFAVSGGLDSAKVTKKADGKIEFQEKELSATSAEEDDGCGINGTCCCRKTIEDENDTTTAIPCCCKPASRPAQTSSTSSNSSTSIPISKPQFKLFTGRPHCRNIVRKVLEEAEGESAVVVCGPKGLQDDARSSVIALCDERAVHKGTGAQGVYLHTEGFAY